MTGASAWGDRPPWFHSRSASDPDETAAGERRRRELVEERRRLLRSLQVWEAEVRRPAPDPDVAVGFWSPTRVLGFRFWYVFPRSLQGLRQTWLGPEFEARCARLGMGAPHARGGCHCGIYALKAAGALPRPEGIRTRPGAGIAYGVVALSGVVVEHEYGYRAARAEAVAVVVVRRGRAVGGSDRFWIKRLFQRPDCALHEVDLGVWPRVQPVAPSPEGIVRFLQDEASKLERT